MPLHQTLGRGVRRTLCATALAVATFAAAAADGEPGRFDFYVLALSWSPSYCANTRRPDPDQCELKVPGFVVHGLWPQYERGYPEYCASRTPRRLPASAMRGISDLFPSGRLAQYQWEKHGICSGLRPERYFSLLRQAREGIVIPDSLVDPDGALEISPGALEAAFIEANPGMSARGIAVACGSPETIEVRICLTKTLGFRRCREVDARACRRSSIRLADED